MKQLENALLRSFGFFRYIGFEFTEDENGFVMTLRPAEEKEWQSEAVTDIFVRRDGYYSEMTFYVDKADTTEEEVFLFCNKYNEGASPVKLFVADADDSYAIVGTMPNVLGVDPDYTLDFSLSAADAEELAEDIRLSVFYLKGYMDTVITDFTGEEVIPVENDENACAAGV